MELWMSPGELKSFEHAMERPHEGYGSSTWEVENAAHHKTARTGRRRQPGGSFATGMARAAKNQGDLEGDIRNRDGTPPAARSETRQGKLRRGNDASARPSCAAPRLLRRGIGRARGCLVPRPKLELVYQEKGASQPFNHLQREVRHGAGPGCFGPRVTMDPHASCNRTLRFRSVRHSAAREQRSVHALTMGMKERPHVSRRETRGVFWLV
jgi:hypothetical protein